MGAVVAQRLHTVEDLGTHGVILTNHIDHFVSIDTQRSGICRCNTGRCVDDDIIKLRPYRSDHFLQIFLPEQRRGIINGIVTGKHIEGSVLIAQEKHFLQALRQTFAKADGRLIHPQKRLDTGAAQVGVDQQHGFPVLSQCQRSVHRQRGLALRGNGAGKQNNIFLLVLHLTQQLQTQKAEGFTKGGLGGLVCDQCTAVFAIAALLVFDKGNVRKTGQIQHLFYIVGIGDGAPHGRHDTQHDHSDKQAASGALQCAVLPGKCIVRRTGSDRLPCDHKLGLADNRTAYLRIDIHHCANNLIRIVCAGACDRQYKEVGFRHRGSADAAVDKAAAQFLTDQLPHQVGGEQIREGFSRLLGSGIVIVVAITEHAVAVSGADTDGEYSLRPVHGSVCAHGTKTGKGAAQNNERKNSRPEFTRKGYHFAQ